MIIKIESDEARTQDIAFQKVIDKLIEDGLIPYSVDLIKFLGIEPSNTRDNYNMYYFEYVFEVITNERM